MSTVIWRGDAIARAQINTVTPASVTTGNTFTVTINGKSITFTATAGTVANVTAGLTAAVNSSTIPEFKEILAADNSTNFTLTARTAGTPFTQTSSAAVGTGSGSPTLTTSTTTTNSSPNDWSNTSNWVSGALPVNSDDVIIDGPNDILYGLSQSAVTLTSLTIRASFTGRLGLPYRNAAGYVEYRPTYLAIGSTTITVGVGTGNMSGRVKIDTGTVQTALIVYGTANPADSGVSQSVLWKGTHVNSTISVAAGSVGLAALPGDSAVVFKLTKSGTSVVYCGAGCSMTGCTVNQFGGALTVEAAGNALTTLNCYSGQVTILDGNCTTINLEGGRLTYFGSGTIATLNVATGGTADFSKGVKACTVTNCNVYSGGTLTNTFRTATFTNPIALPKTSIPNVTIDLGFDIFVTT